MTRILLMVAAMAAGLAGSMQSSANSSLASRITLSTAILVNSIVAVAASALFYFFRGAPGEFFPVGISWTRYIGGVLGFSIIAVHAYTFPRIGAVLTLSLFVFGLGVGSLVIEHFGIFGIPRQPVSLARIGGVLLVLGGVYLLKGGGAS